MGFHKWGYPFIAGWFISWKIPKMDDDWGASLCWETFSYRSILDFDYHKHGKMTLV